MPLLRSFFFYLYRKLSTSESFVTYRGTIHFLSRAREKVTKRAPNRASLCGGLFIGCRRRDFREGTSSPLRPPSALRGGFSMVSAFWTRCRSVVQGPRPETAGKLASVMYAKPSIISQGAAAGLMPPALLVSASSADVEASPRRVLCAVCRMKPEGLPKGTLPSGRVFSLFSPRERKEAAGGTQERARFPFVTYRRESR